MKADQACIVIFREKTAFRRYMICLFHVLDRLGSLTKRTINKKSYKFKAGMIAQINRLLSGLGYSFICCLKETLNEEFYRKTS